MKIHIKTASTLVATLLVTSSAITPFAIAQEGSALPRQPAAEGSGDQTQSVDLLQDRVSVTVNSGGTFDASTSGRSLDASGAMSVDVDTPLGGTRLGAQTPGHMADTQPANAPTEAFDPNVDPQNDQARAVRNLECFDDQTFGSILSAPAISRLGANTKLTLLVHCDTSVEMNTGQALALAENLHLMQMLDRARIAPEEVVALTVAADGENQIHIVR